MTLTNPSRILITIIGTFKNAGEGTRADYTSRKGVTDTKEGLRFVSLEMTMANADST